jgi:hypothetical protein
MDRNRGAPDDAIIEHVRKKLGEAIRSQYDLARPLPDGLYQLVMELDRRSAERNRRPQRRSGKKLDGRRGIDPDAV